MNEAAASEVLLLRAYETTAFGPWTDADRAWATRAALQAVGTQASAEGFVALRAQLGLKKLAPLDPLLARWRALRPWRIEWLLLVVVLGLAAGTLVDRIGSAQRVNLLAPPVWALIAWNLTAYVWLLAQSLFGSTSRGWLRRAVSALLRRWQARRLKPDVRVGSGSGPIGNSRGEGTAAVWNVFIADWAAHSLPLNAARIALLLHLGAAALALGLLGGMYLRGLVLDYRVGWQSTFLDAGTVRSVLATLLAPASTLSGIAVPDVAGVQALRVTSNGQLGVAASAAPWIHLYALQLLLLVVLPRLALALWAAWRAGRLRQHFALPLHEPYFQRLLFLQRGGSTPVHVWPHAHTPDAAAVAALNALFVRVCGDGAQLQVLPTVAYGAEDALVDAPAPGPLHVALFDLAATPEAESQGRLMRSLHVPEAAPPLLLADEAAFVQRFGATSQRLPARRQAWTDLAAAAGCAAVFVNLREPDTAAAEAALQAALMPTPAAI